MTDKPLPSIFNLDELIANILDDSQPLPTGLIEPPAVNTTTPSPASTQGAIIPQHSILQDDGLTAVNPDTPADSLAVTVVSLPAIVLPQFDAQDIASVIDLRNFGTLATLTTRRWYARVKDRQAARDGAMVNGADESAFETQKKLLIGADDKLKRIHRAIDTARTRFYEMSLPWTQTGVNDTGRRSGARLLPNTLFMEFCAELGKLKQEMQDAIADFVPEYPDMIERAKPKLGKRFSILDYPPADTIADHFELTFDFHPIPHGSDFKGLPQQQCEALARSIQDRTAQMLQNAMQDLWVRVHDAVGRMAERLSHPDKVFHHTLVSNVKDVATQMEHLNVLNDPVIEELRHEIVTKLCAAEVDALRKTPTIRLAVAAAAQDIMHKMDRYAKKEV